MCVCVYGGRVLLRPCLPSSLSLSIHLLHKQCVRRKSLEEEEEGVCVGSEENAAFISIELLFSPTHLQHKRCERSLTRDEERRGGACYEPSTTPYDALELQRRIPIKR